jgi:hypothetical protein
MSTTGTNRSILYWSESGGAKTSQIAYLSRRMWREHHKRTRAISADGGSLDPVKPEIDAGLIEAFVVPPIDGKTIALFRKLSLGYWPDMKLLTEQNKLVLRPPTPDTYAEFGLLAWDGLTAVADRVFRDMQQSGMRMGKDDASSVLEQGIDVDYGITGQSTSSAKEKIYAATQSMYMFTQKEIRMLVDNSNTLPFQRTYWTALESKGEDIVGKDTVYGPMLVGTAATPKIPAWFGDCFHAEPMFQPKLGNDQKPIMDAVTKAPILVKTIRCYYNDHQDPRTGFKYKAKPRVPPHLYGELEKKFPGGFFDLKPEMGIDVFLDFEDELFRRSGEGLEKLEFNLESFKAELAKNRPAAIPTVPPKVTTAPSPTKPQ